ncbi:MAG TPA: FG-GAP-like repeat-containing protein [Pyrinomonadaceae bacterium]|nr:FG-GAP-like repeat-containing protein [Pyrinomonadaceae bacterium]
MSLVLCASLGLGQMQPPAQSQDAVGFPDFSGFGLIDSFATLPAERTRLESLCEIRRASLDEASRTVEMALQRISESADPPKAIRLHNASATVYLYKGDTTNAIAQFEEALRIGEANATKSANLAAMMNIDLAALGIAHMRRGEVENCVSNRNADVCIFPLNAAAQHRLRSGSERAIEYFKRYLEREPSNLEVRWLLNVTYQTLGEYPGKVPGAYLIPPAAFESKENIGRFVDIAPSLGLDTMGAAGGSIVDDFDNDGFLDVVETSFDPCQPMRVFRNNGDGTFSDVSARSHLAEQLGGINSVQTDYNNDGWLDIFVMRGGWEWPMRNSLLRNNGNGTFSDVTLEAGLLSIDHPTHSAAWADFDNDGWLDIFIGHERTPSQLFRNKGDGTFEDVSARAGVNRVAFTKAVAWGDYDNDGYPDLYVSNYGEANFLYHNKRDGTFEEIAAQLGVEQPRWSFPTWFWDYDNDGKLDLFVASYFFANGEWVRPYLGLARQGDSMKLYRNTGNGKFADVTKETGLDRSVAAMGANFGDLDNDGFPDFYLGSGAPTYTALMPNLLYRNQGGRSFVEISSSSGTGHLQKGHGVSFADIDNDGDEDIFENLGGAVPGDKYNSVLFANPGHANNWIAIKLVGFKTNRFGIGAKIKLTLKGPGGETGIRYREVSSGGSFGASPLMQHIGIGKSTRITSIEVTWPTSGTRQEFNNVLPNQFIEIKEFDKVYEKRRIRRIIWKRAGGANRHMHTKP